MKKLITLFSLLLLTTFSQAGNINWQKIEEKAQGQTVYFYAWGGSQDTNNYLRWANKRLQAKHGVTLKHVKVTDTSEAITRLVAEKSAGKNNNGSVDMVWINGENFKSMKDFNLLTTPFVEHLPNWQYVDKSLPVESDFTEPTMGLEAPWGLGQLVFIYDKNKVDNPPQSHREMLVYAKSHPNKLTYPRPPSFYGTTFLKSALLELSENSDALYSPVDDKTFQRISAPLWSYLEAFHQVAWRQGKQFPANSAETMQLLDDGELDLAISMNPNEVFSAQANGLLRDSTAAYALEGGALSNIHFLSIPWNATAKEGALVAINFMLSPEAQSKKADISVWGDPTVLKSSNLSSSSQKTNLFKSISEPHPSWQVSLETEWQKRYGH